MKHERQSFLKTHRANIDKLSHDGRGIARIEGKTTFITGALAGEDVIFRYTRQKKTFDEGEVVTLLNASPDRTIPPCAHADRCGGCSLQYMTHAAQVRHKQDVLLELLAHVGLRPQHLALPLTADSLHYRARARISVRYVEKKQHVLVGFREKANPRFITELQSCQILDNRIGLLIEPLRCVIQSLQSYRDIAQVEITAGDQQVALIFRHLSPLKAEDEVLLRQFGALHGFWIYLQPGSVDSIVRVYPQTGDTLLSYRLSPFNIEIKFFPGDFIQINRELNRQMVTQAIKWMDLKTSDIVLDLFCGLGNFSLPMATLCQRVIGIEGDEKMSVRARHNAAHNGLSNLSFYTADLMRERVLRDFSNQGINKVLIDPPRAGALEIMQKIDTIKPERIVYVSCHPATLVRDALILMNQWGYRLERIGVIDMFSHTAHVESMALFTRG